MLYFFIIAGSLIRILSYNHVLPYIPNFAPIAAMALFGGVYLNKKYALAVPLVALFLGDIFIGTYNIYLMIAVYSSFLAIGLIGLWLKNNKNVANIIGASLFGSIIFFTITNFAMWAIQPLMPQAIYPHTWQGLVMCYTMGLPFFRNTILGDLFYVGSMFGLAEFALFVANNNKMRRAYLNDNHTDRMARKGL